MASEQETQPMETSELGKPEEKEPISLTLKSCDGEEFTIQSDAASFAETLNNMVEDDCADSIIPLPVVDGKTLAKVITYLNQRVKVPNTEDDRDKFHAEFLQGEEMANLFNLIVAANYMNIKDLLRAVSMRIADMMKNKSVKWVRKVFKIENDFTEKEEEAVRNEYPWAHEDLDPDSD